MSRATLAQWLEYIESLHPKDIELGLERSRRVASALALEFKVPVITVAGTNGKGSTCAMLESILLAAGYRVGLYIKPHFLAFNERARINGVEASDAALIAEFEKVEAARCLVAPATELTYYEFTTLAILNLLALSELDVVILEVGLGGRLDTVNLIDANCAVVTSIDIDHAAYLGDTREAIGREKAGIFRPGRPAICGDPKPPQSLLEHASACGADLWLLGRDFNFAGDKTQWNFAARGVRRNALQYPALRGANQLLNAASALAALEALREALPVSQQAVRTGLVTVELAGRFQVLAGTPTLIYDVAHNPHAAAALAANLDQMGFYPYSYAVFGAMADKDIDGIVAALGSRIDHWFLVPLPSPRAANTERLRAALQRRGLDPGEQAATLSSSVENGWAQALGRAHENDRIVVFGSFYTVAGVMLARALQRH